MHCNLYIYKLSTQLNSNFQINCYFNETFMSIKKKSLIQPFIYVFQYNTRPAKREFYLNSFFRLFSKHIVLLRAHLPLTSPTKLTTFESAY